MYRCPTVYKYNEPMTIKPEVVYPCLCPACIAIRTQETILWSMPWYSWIEDGDSSPLSGTSDIVESIRRMLILRGGLKLNDLIIFLVENTSDEFVRMK